MKHTPMRLELVDPQPNWIESSGRWSWPLPERAHFPGCCTEVVTASREWWEYAPSEAKPHPHAEGVQLRDEVWYWAIPFESLVDAQRQELARLREALKVARDRLVGCGGVVAAINEGLGGGLPMSENDSPISTKGD